MLNKFIGIGRLTKDPEMRTTESGTVVTRFTIAIDRKYKKEETDFLNVIAFNKTAEFVSKYFTKGQMILVVGSIQTRSWEKDGKKNYATEIIAEEVNFAGDKKDKQSSTSAEDFIPVDDDPDTLPF